MKRGRKSLIVGSQRAQLLDDLLRRHSLRLELARLAIKCLAAKHGVSQVTIWKYERALIVNNALTIPALTSEYLRDSEADEISHG